MDFEIHQAGIFALFPTTVSKMNFATASARRRNRTKADAITCKCPTYQELALLAVGFAIRIWLDFGTKDSNIIWIT